MHEGLAVNARKVIESIKRRQFLFEELVKRDFKKKYKRSVLGMGWSVLNPLLLLLVMWVVFSNLFGRNIAHYTTYLFCGNLLFSWFGESTRDSMSVLRSNASIITKIDVPKGVFLVAKNVQVLINFLITLAVFFVFCAIDRIEFTWKMLLLVYPIVTLAIFNLGVGYLLSALYVFYKDMKYLWSVFLRLVMYGSAIFYPITIVPEKYRVIMLCNPVYQHIAYFRQVVIDGVVPSGRLHLLLLGSALAAMVIGRWYYRRNDKEFLYYV